MASQRNTTMIMMSFPLFLLAILVPLTWASNVDENVTNVGVYLNKISSCNYNSLSGNLLCASQEFETLIQYHNVKYVKMCDYHYCIQFNDEDNTMACSGYLLKLIGGNMDTYLNPLTPNDSLVSFDANSNNIHKIGKSFLGYNVLIDSFVQNVQTTFEKKILDIECKEPHTTCLTFENQNESVCFGSSGYTFYNATPSLMLGLVIPLLLSIGLYLSSYLFCCKSVAHNYFVIFIVIPIQVVVISMLILFQAERFIVKTYVFMIGAIFGIILGHIATTFILKLFNCLKPKKAFVEDQGENVRLTVGDKRCSEFVIGDDEASDDDEKYDKTMVNIELSGPTKEEDREISI